VHFVYCSYTRWQNRAILSTKFLRVTCEIFDIYRMLRSASRDLTFDVCGSCMPMVSVYFMSYEKLANIFCWFLIIDKFISNVSVTCRTDILEQIEHITNRCHASTADNTLQQHSNNNVESRWPKKYVAELRGKNHR
jgi:hypothetical protein